MSGCCQPAKASKDNIAIILFLFKQNLKKYYEMLRILIKDVESLEKYMAGIFSILQL